MPGFSAEANPALVSRDGVRNAFPAFSSVICARNVPCLAHSLCTCLHCPVCLDGSLPGGTACFSLFSPSATGEAVMCEAFEAHWSRHLLLGHPPAGKGFSG